MAAIYFHKQRKKWYIILTLPPKEKGGKRTQIWSRGFDKREQAVEEEPHFVLEHRGKPAPRKQCGNTFHGIVTDWLESVEDVVRPTTFAGYRNISRHLVHAFDATRVEDITQDDIAEYIKQKKKELSGLTARKHLRQLRAILRFAVGRGHTSRCEADFIKAPGVEHKEIRILAADEIGRLVAGAKGQTQLVVLLGLFAGMRASEVRGLKWEDVDFARSIISVRRTYSKGDFAAPKSKTSKRAIQCPKDLMEVLGESHKKTGLVITNSEGGPLDWDNFTRREYRPTLKATKLEGVTFHALRHTYVSRLIVKGMPLKWIQKQAGHSSISVTMDIYGHLMPDDYDVSGPLNDTFGGLI